jgi:hypothetical protein
MCLNSRDLCIAIEAEHQTIVGAVNYMGLYIHVHCQD